MGDILQKAVVLSALMKKTALYKSTMQALKNFGILSVKELYKACSRCSYPRHAAMCFHPTAELREPPVPEPPVLQGTCHPPGPHPHTRAVSLTNRGLGIKCLLTIFQTLQVLLR